MANLDSNRYRGFGSIALMNAEDIADTLGILSLLAFFLFIILIAVSPFIFQVLWATAEFTFIVFKQVLMITWIVLKKVLIIAWSIFKTVLTLILRLVVFFWCWQRRTRWWRYFRGM